MRACFNVIFSCVQEHPGHAPLRNGNWSRFALPPSGLSLQECLSTFSIVRPHIQGLHLPPPMDPIQGFEGLEISVSGFNGTERMHLKLLIGISGAKYTGNLSRYRNSHLICARPSGTKLSKALEWKLHVVTLSWLLHSLELWKRQPEEKYPVEELVSR